MSNPATAAQARSYRPERVLTVLIGLIALACGVAALLLGLGWLGEFRASLPVLDPVVLAWLADHAVWARLGALLLGVLLVLLGLTFTIRSLRPEHHPDLALDDTPGHRLVVTSGALADAVAGDAEQVDGVSRARARIVGKRREPALRLNLWLREGADVAAVWGELETLLARTKECLGVQRLPTAVRIELAAARGQRVR